MSIPLWAREGGADSPVSIAANADFAASGPSYGKSYYLIYLLYYHLTMISLYGFHRKQGAHTRIRGNKLRQGAGSFRGGMR